MNQSVFSTKRRFSSLNSSRKDWFPFVLCGLLGMSVVQTSLPHLSKAFGEFSRAQDEPTLIPPSQIERFAFGYGELLADVFWIRAIQDLEYCGRHRSHEEYSEDLKRPLNICTKGWVFHMLDAVTRLAPRFQIAYTRGAVALSVLVNDREGAAVLFNRGGEALPQSWPVHYAAGYHFMIELKDYERAAFHLREAAKSGAPDWVTLLAARMALKAGAAEFGMRALEEFYKDDPFEKWPERAQTRYRELQAIAKDAQEP